MTQRFLEVITVGADGRRAVENVPMTAAMARLADELQAAWDEGGCRCRPPRPDHVRIVPRGHSVDAICGDCGGLRQVG